MLLTERESHSHPGGIGRVGHCDNALVRVLVVETCEPKDQVLTYLLDQVLPCLVGLGVIVSEAFAAR
jgi:hypothetical protein